MADKIHPYLKERAAALLDEVRATERHAEAGELTGAAYDEKTQELLDRARELIREKNRAEGDDMRTTLNNLSRALGYSDAASTRPGGNSLEDALLGARDPLRHHHHHDTSRAKVLKPFRGFGDGRWGDEYLGWRQKQLVGPGQWLPLALPLPAVVELGRPVQYMRSLLPTTLAAGALARFLTQTIRDNAAAVVEPLQVKPESKYALEWVTKPVSVVAHTSEPMNRFDLTDAPALAAFLDGELRHGLELAIENLLINGAEATEIIGDNPDPIEGFLSTSGVLSQDYETDPLTSLRLGVGEVEAQGSPVTGIVMNPADWTAAEVQKDEVGRFMLDQGPGDRSARRLWSAPVVATPGMPAGQALVGDFTGSSALFVADNGQVQVQMSENVADSFIRNAVVWRCETRLALGVLRPAAFCVVDLAP